MDGGWRSLARSHAGTVAIAALAQAAALWVVFGLAQANPVLLVVLEILAGFVVGGVVRGWLGAMAGALIGGTIVCGASAYGNFGDGFVEALVLALCLFTPSYLLGSAARLPDVDAYGEEPDARASEKMPSAKIAIAMLIFAADIGVVVWFISSFRIYGP